MAVQIVVEAAVALQVVAVPVQAVDAAVVAGLGWRNLHLQASAVPELQNSRLLDSAVMLEQKFGLWLLFRLVFCLFLCLLHRFLIIIKFFIFFTIMRH